MRQKSLLSTGAILAFALAVLVLAPHAAQGASPQPAASAEKVNINTAGVDELVALPGIGKAYAERIIEYRQKNGPFKRIEDILNVRGIGEKTFERIRDRLTLGKS